MRKLCTAMLVSAAGLGAFAASAQATTLGTPFPPMGSSLNTCGESTEAIAQATSDATTPYTVPGPGTLTQWQLPITSDDSSGQAATLLVLKPAGDAFDVVATNAQTIPDPAPDTTTFALATPIQVTGGETFGLYTAGSVDITCYFHGGATPAGDTLAALNVPAPPAPGQTLDRAIGDSPPGYTLNLAVNFVPTAPPPTSTPPAKHKKKCKHKHKKHSAAAAKKKCKKKRR
jgi:hypothetical protein